MAQTVRDVEEGSYVMCAEMVGAPQEEEACIDWIVTSTCASTYKMRVGKIAQWIPYENLYRYKVEAESRLPATCEAMSAVELNFEILHGLRDEFQFPVRWDRMVSWAQKLHPEQRFIVAGWMLQEPDIEVMRSRSSVQSYLSTCLKDVESAMPRVTPEMTSFIVQLSQVDESLLTLGAKAVVVSDEISTQRYTLARRHLLELDLASQSPEVQTYLMPKVEGAFFQLFGHADLAHVTCFPEVEFQKSPRYRLFEYLVTRSDSLNIREHFVYELLSRCEVDSAVSEVMSVYPQTRHLRDMDNLMKGMMSAAEVSGRDALIASFVEQGSALDNASRFDFQGRYGSRLVKLAIDAGRSALERCDLAMAQRLLGTLDSLGDSANTPEILFEKGRLHWLQNRGSLARAHWQQVITSLRRGALVEEAYTLSMISLAREGQWKEADAMKASFIESFPESIWISRLPNSFKDAKMVLKCPQSR